MTFARGRARFSLVVPVLLSVAPWGCRHESESSAIDVANAQAKLTLVLDSWVRGVPSQEFHRQNQTVDFYNTISPVARPKLRSYEIGPGGRESDAPKGVIGYSFPVKLTLEYEADAKPKECVGIVRTLNRSKFAVTLR